MPTCEYHGCSVSACFNIFGELKAKFCKAHKTDEMINIVDKLCETCNTKRALYNYKGKTGGIYCLDHIRRNGQCERKKMCI